MNFFALVNHNVHFYCLLSKQKKRKLWNVYILFQWFPLVEIYHYLLESFSGIWSRSAGSPVGLWGISVCLPSKKHVADVISKCVWWKFCHLQPRLFYQEFWPSTVKFLLPTSSSFLQKTRRKLHRIGTRNNCGPLSLDLFSVTFT